MSKQTLNLGAVLSKLLESANSNFTELYGAVGDIQDRLEDGGKKAVVYETVEKMVEGLNAGADGAGNPLTLTEGDEIYILDDDSPDFWVSGVLPNSTTGTQPTEWEKGENYAFGYYSIRVSKASDIDLADYQKIANLVQEITETSAEGKYPSALAVWNLAQSLRDEFADYVAENGGGGEITVEDLKAEYVSVATTDTCWNERKDGTTNYYEIVVEKTDTALGVFNLSGEEIVVQKRYKDNLLYLCVGTKKIDCTIRKLNGSAVSGGGGSGMTDAQKGVLLHLLSLHDLGTTKETTENIALSIGVSVNNPHTGTANFTPPFGEAKYWKLTSIACTEQVSSGYNPIASITDANAWTYEITTKKETTLPTPLVDVTFTFEYQI